MSEAYEQFKEKFNKLCDHTLAKPDKQICLDYFHLIDDNKMEECNQKHSACGAPLCLAGNLPEVFPGEFKWFSFYVRGKTESEEATIYDLAGEESTEYVGLTRLFSVNSEVHTDREEVKRRQELVNSSSSFAELDERLSPEEA